MTVFSRHKPGASALVLAGIGIGALATAITGLVMNFAPNPWALSELVYWLMGSLKNADGIDVLIAGPLTLVGFGLLIVSGPALRVLGLGEDTAQSLGVSIGRTQWLIVLGCALCIGSGVAVAGAIGFVGLFVPHILRFLTQADEAWLIPLSALGGASFLVLIDTLIRATSGPGTPLYLGIVTSLIGVPFFLWLAWRQS
jgi:iron complex transport system permease protein